MMKHKLLIFTSLFFISPKTSAMLNPKITPEAQTHIKQSLAALRYEQKKITVTNNSPAIITITHRLTITDDSHADHLLSYPAHHAEYKIEPNQTNIISLPIITNYKALRDRKIYTGKETSTIALNISSVPTRLFITIGNEKNDWFNYGDILSLNQKNGVFTITNSQTQKTLPPFPQ